MDLTALFLNHVPAGQGTLVTPDPEPAGEPDLPSCTPPVVRRFPRLDPKAIDQLVADYLAGATSRELAASYHIDITTVHSHLKRRDLALRPVRKLQPPQVEQAVALYRAALRSTPSPGSSA